MLALSSGLCVCGGCVGVYVSSAVVHASLLHEVNPAMSHPVTVLSVLLYILFYTYTHTFFVLSSFFTLWLFLKE